MTDEKKTEITDKNVMKRRIWVPACPTCDCACSDDDETESKHDIENLVWEIPGVNKEDIHLDVAKDRVRLKAPRGDTVEYISEYLFSCPADMDGKPNASYKDGVLNLEVPLKCTHPYENATHVNIK